MKAYRLFLFNHTILEIRPITSYLNLSTYPATYLQMSIFLSLTNGVCYKKYPVRRILYHIILFLYNLISIKLCRFLISTASSFGFEALFEVVHFFIAVLHKFRQAFLKRQIVVIVSVPIDIFRPSYIIP